MGKECEGMQIGAVLGIMVCFCACAAYALAEPEQEQEEKSGPKDQ